MLRHGEKPTPFSRYLTGANNGVFREANSARSGWQSRLTKISIVSTGGGGAIQMAIGNWRRARIPMGSGEEIRCAACGRRDPDEAGLQIRTGGNPAKCSRAVRKQASRSPPARAEARGSATQERARPTPPGSLDTTIEATTPGIARCERQSTDTKGDKNLKVWNSREGIFREMRASAASRKEKLEPPIGVEPTTY